MHSFATFAVSLWSLSTHRSLSLLMEKINCGLSAIQCLLLPACLVKCILWSNLSYNVLRKWYQSRKTDIILNIRKASFDLRYTLWGFKIIILIYTPLIIFFSNSTRLIFFSNSQYIFNSHMLFSNLIHLLLS